MWYINDVIERDIESLKVLAQLAKIPKLLGRISWPEFESGTSQLYVSLILVNYYFI
jgi:hypothetical protein